MKAELVSFRLCILVTVALLLGAGGYALYAKKQSNVWWELTKDWGQRWMETAKACDAARATRCENLEWYGRERDESRDYWTKYAERFDFAWRMAAFGPVAVWVLFFSLRWAFTGRWRPLGSPDK